MCLGLGQICAGMADLGVIDPKLGGVWMCRTGDNVMRKQNRQGWESGKHQCLRDIKKDREVIDK